MKMPNIAWLLLYLVVGIAGCGSSNSSVPYAANRMPLDPVMPTHLRAMFMGVSTILIQDGDTSVMTDGFFTRPSFTKVALGTIGPDDEVIKCSLDRAGVKRLAAVLVAHSHYDHALDSAVVAEQTQAILVGSESTRQIARGEGFPEDRFQLIPSTQPLHFGRLTVRVIPSLHSPNAKFPGQITQPLKPPVRASAYKDGGCFSYLMEVGNRRILIHASANVIPSAMDGVKADTVFLGVGTLGRQSDDFIKQYWNELVTKTGAKRVILVHWDDFFKPLSQPLRPMPYPLDHFDRTMTQLIPLAVADHAELRIPTEFAPIDLGIVD